MVYPPGQGKSGEYLMQLWRQYLEQYAENEGSVEKQIIVAAYHAAEVFGSLSKTLDRTARYRELIDERVEYFEEGSRRAQDFRDCMVNASFTLYNHLNTLGHQFTAGNSRAEELIRQVDDQVKARTQSAQQIERAATALRACFPLLSLITLVADQKQAVTRAIQQVEQRFAAASSQASSDWDHFLNALYRLVEMMQIFVTLSDPELTGQVHQIASRFQEEDQAADLWLKLSNGFCRLFELGHLLTTHLDETL